MRIKVDKITVYDPYYQLCCIFVMKLMMIIESLFYHERCSTQREISIGFRKITRKNPERTPLLPSPSLPSEHHADILRR